MTDLRDISTTPDHSGTDTLASIELLRFADMDVTLAVDSIITVTTRVGLGMTGVTLLAATADNEPSTFGITNDSGQSVYSTSIAGEIRVTATKSYNPVTDGIITAADALNALRLAVGLSPSWG